ncbi:hypothetical protein FA13DRAFT_1789759 [Coprinellus micaceus]|uniref:DUF6533 domain-containing protein n=1 Tax=Coprinellus micaceus TaxID=71717 RepID=A0A4Y7TIG0_COPMI|nr:hypothetical protein FA13DRAFT_1789759 [Coprinellus micaceus]
MGDPSEDFSAIQSWFIGGDIFLAKPRHLRKFPRLSPLILCNLQQCLDYFHTLEDEVQYIWPERWTLGKILFLATRYFTLASGPYVCWVSFINGNSRITEKEYLIHIDTINVVTVLTTYLPTATLLLCLHALLGAGRKAGYAILAAYVGMLATSCTLMGNHLSLSYLTPSPYPTLYPYEYQARTWAFRIAGNYWLFARELCMFLFGCFVMYRRYRSYIRRQLEAGAQNDWILNVIRRDGAIYYIASLVVTLYTCITYTPGFPVIVRDLPQRTAEYLAPPDS